MIVDDSETSVVALTGILSPDYSIYAARNGQEGIEAAKTHLPDVILLDVIMPEMDGYETIAVLKSLESTREIPVIFVSGPSSPEHEEKGLALGAVDYISKPLSPAIVKLRVRHQIQIQNYIRTIEHLSRLDQLTEMPNRRSFDERFFSEWKKSKRDKTPTSVLMIDIDDFKKCNDTYGHLQGDIVLKTIAQVITRTLHRPGDFAARWGGEEFIVLLPDTDANGAMTVAEQLRNNIENAVVPLSDGQKAKVSVSVGVNTQESSADSSIDDFINFADDALYTAKRDGKNRVCRYDDRTCSDARA